MAHNVDVSTPGASLPLQTGFMPISQAPYASETVQNLSSHKQQHMTSQSAQGPPAKESKDTLVAAAACLACRSKHLKCDGQTPCSRCLANSNDCVYVASRRGYKGPRRASSHNPNKRQATSPPDFDLSEPGCHILLGSTSSSANIPTTTSTAPIPSQPPFLPNTSPVSDGHSTPIQSHTSTPGPSSRQVFKPYCTGNEIDSMTLVIDGYSTSTPIRLQPTALSQRCIDSFYQHFHSSHPFVLPRDFLLQIAKEGTIDPLLAAIRWVGSIFIDVGPSRTALFNEAHRLICEYPVQKDGFLVQAMMLLIVGLDGSCEQDKARHILRDAEAAAVEIGLNTRPFATQYGRGMPALEESWRRTWWDLFVIDGMIAGVHRATNFLLFDLSTDVGLPCEEHQYLSGSIPPTMYIEDMQDDGFTETEYQFSSFAYRILCAQNLGKFMRCPPIFRTDDENLAHIEALLTNWRLHLPASKKHSLHADGQLDEMMFQAHMMLYATSILLHKPLSQLDSSSTQEITSCAPHDAVVSGDLFNTHTQHTIASATEISNLITHRVPLLSHTPFFTCVITHSSIVHLSKWSLCFISHNDDDLRQLIRLNIGALAKLSDVWVAAEKACGQVRGVAQDIYKVKKLQQQNPNYWLALGISQQDMIHSIAADETIIGDIEKLQGNLPSTTN